MRKYLALWMLFFLVSNNAIAANASPPKVIGATTADTMFAKMLLDKGGITFVDVRSAEDFAAGHIVGAKNLSFKGEGFTEQALSAVVKKNKAVLFYCNGVQCSASAGATQQALDWGWTKIFYYRDGYPIWERSGLDTEK